MEKPRSPEAGSQSSNFFVRSLKRRLTKIRHRQINELLPGFPDYDRKDGDLGLTTVEAIRDSNSVQVNIKREETRGLPACETTIKIIRDDRFGRIRGIKATVLELPDGETPCPRIYDSYTSKPDTMSLSEVVGGLRQAHRIFNPQPNKTTS